MTDSLHADYEALRQGCGLADRSAVGRLALLGADRQRFLNGQVTCDVKALAPGDGAYGFFTSHQGKILADVAVLALEDRLWLELPPGRAEEMAAHLGKYIIVDRVEVLPLDDYRVLTLAGPRAAEVLHTLAPDLPERPEQPEQPERPHRPELPERPWSHLHLAELGGGVLLVRQAGLGVSAWSLWTPADLTEELTTRLLAVPGVRPVGPRSLELVRTEAGIPLYGRDFGADNFPQESGLEEQAVSYTKGCYLGQEVVARIHYRGGVHKGLAGLVFPAGLPPAGAKLLLEEKEVGTVTTAVESPALGRAIGLAILNHRAAEPGTRLAVVAEDGDASGGPAEVHPLPFVPAA
jgi:folate-binding protein YgfZ